MDQGILSALKTKYLTEYTEFYDRNHAMAADADLPELEARLAWFQSRVNVAVETSALD